MRKIMTVLLFCAGCSLNSFAEKMYLVSTAQNGFSKIILVAGKTYMVTATEILKIEKKGLRKIRQFNFNCNDACAFSNELALATDSGIMVYSPDQNSISKFLPAEANIKADHVVADNSNHLWITSMFKGAFMVDDDRKLVARVQAPVIYSLASTPDGNVWIGTNVGLYKIATDGKEIYRYEEEGIEGFELPDNLVERIFADDNSSVWAMLDGTMAFIPGKDFEGDIPSYNYVGSKENKVFAIAKLPLSSTAYLFATAEGLMYTAGLNGLENIHTGEIHQTYEEKAFLLDNKMCEKPEQLKNDAIINITNIGSNTWFTATTGIWKISTKKLMNNLQKKNN